MSKRSFVAGNHFCWFSKNSEYQKMTVNELIKLNPSYIKWCKDNLKNLKFGTSLSKRINKSTNPNHEN